MKIVLNSESNDFINNFAEVGSNEGNAIIRAKTERILFNEIVTNTADVFIIDAHKHYTQRAIDYIRRKNPTIPIIILQTILDEEDHYTWPNNASYYMFNNNYEIGGGDMYEAVIRTIQSYNTTFEKLKRITETIKDKIEFGPCIYDPTRRTFHLNGKLIKKMSPKEGGVIEVLSSNYGAVVKKELILEKIWHKTSFFVSRSMDVYVSNLRKLFVIHNIPMVINSISGAGLILEHE